MDYRYFSKNGELLPLEEAVVPLSNIEYQYGFGVYENIRVQNGIPYFLSEHLKRLEESARIIGLEHTFSDSTVEKYVANLIEKIEIGTYNLKILLIGAKSAENASLYILPLNPRFPAKKIYHDGVACLTHEYERPFPHAKTLNMLGSYLAYRSASEADCYDALLVNSRGCITEGTRTNFFCIEGTTLFSAPENEILLGVTRKAVLKVATDIGFKIEERDLTPENVSSYDGAFLTSTSSKIVPVRRIDERACGKKLVSLAKLMKAFDQFLEECRGKIE